MLTDLLERMGVFLDKLSERERRLAVAVFALMPVLAFLVLGRAAYSHVERLDRRIDQLSDDIVKYNKNIAQKQSVNVQFAKISAQHSSSWTEAEIQGRLRMELYRLAEKLPPPLKADGTPAATESAAFGKLFQDLELGSGALRDGGEGYKEYFLSVRTPLADFNDAVSYLERLQDSPQMLRIETMLLKRSPIQTDVTLDLDIVRTVVVGSIEVPDQAAPLAADVAPLDWTLAAWKAEDCDKALAAAPLTEASKTLEVLANAPNGRVYLEQMVAAGRLYDFVADIKSEGASRLGIQEVGAVDLFAGEKMLPANGKTYRYHVRFTAPGEPGTQVPVNLPVLTLETAGAKVFIENLLLQQVED